MNTILDYCIANEDLILNFNQDSFKWKNKYNKEPFINITDFNYIIKEIPEKIGRVDIINAFKDDKFYKGFIMSMVWGGIGTRPSKGNSGDITTSDAYKAFAYGQSAINDNLFNIKGFIKQGKIECAYKSLENEYKIPGVGPSYFTKILSFISKSHEDGSNLLIYDKWTKLIHIHLLFDLEKTEKAYELYQKLHLKSFFYKGSNNKYIAELISPKRNKSWDAYSDYCERITTLAKTLTNEFQKDITPFNLESFLFGKDRKSAANRNDSNPRCWVLKHYIDNYKALIQ